MKRPYLSGSGRGGSSYSHAKKPFGKPFAKKPSFGGSSEKYKATCSEGGNSCMVPFKPNGHKPVHCSDCFRGNGGAQGGDRRFEQKRSSSYGDRRTGDRPSFKRPYSPAASTDSSISKQLAEMNKKLDRILATLGSSDKEATKAYEIPVDLDEPSMHFDV